MNFPDPLQGPWRLLALNSNIKLGKGSPQLKWLKGELDAIPPGRCVLAFSHAFHYSSGFHGHADSSDLAAPVVASKNLVDAYRALVAGRVSVFLAGHDHHFEQFARTDAEGAKSEQGVRSFVVGTGGKRLYQRAYSKRWAFSEAYSHESYGVLRMELYHDRYRWAFVAAAGSEDVALPVSEDNCRK